MGYLFEDAIGDLEMKTILAIVCALMVFTGQAHAVTLQVTQSNDTFIEFNQGGTLFRINLNTLRQGSAALRAADLKTRVQTFAAVRQSRSEIPLDDPVILTIRVARDCSIRPEFPSCSP